METIQNAIDAATASRDARIKELESNKQRLTGALNAAFSREVVFMGGIDDMRIELAELREDKARIDWLELTDRKPLHQTEGLNLRQQIDEAMRTK